MTYIFNLKKIQRVKYFIKFCKQNFFPRMYLQRVYLYLLSTLSFVLPTAKIQQYRGKRKVTQVNE